MAEINFNNLYDQLSPMDKMFYDQQFQKSYNPNQENMMLSSQNAYEQMKSVYDAQQQAPEKSFFDLLNPFSSASAAEMPQVPNVSLGTPKINFNTGITSASSAIPNINGVPIINTGAYNQKLQNTDLVSQIIAENQAANADNSQSFLENDPAFGQLFFQREQDPNNPTNTLYAYKQDSSMLPSYGGVSGYKNVGIPQINNQVPLNFDTSYGVANEEDVEQEFLPDQKPSGIEKLFEFLGKIPTPFNLARRGLESLRGSESLSDFRNSRTGAEFFKKRRDREALARDPNVFKDARDTTNRIQRDTGRNDRPDRNISSVTRSSAARSRGVGGGGYTKSDSNRESYRGR